MLARARALFEGLRPGARPGAARRAPRSSTRTSTSATTSTACPASYEELETIQERYGISRAFMFCLDEHDREPAFRAPNDRTLAFAERSGGRLVPFVRLDLSGPDPIGEARALPRPRRARDQAPPARAAVRAQRRAARAGVRARRRAPRADPDPRRPRPAADRGPPARARRPLPRLAPDRRARRDRRPRRARRALRRAPGRLLRHLGLEPGRPARPLPAASPRSRCSSRRTTPTGSSRRRS